ncbi:DUF4097 family beta strand repeat-containing protein [Streptomyces sp. CRN 30]|uniref:DUF4097 family beta strand repeat-containing protein n=1 Tax=Streptomyces sp. CRN 30 TaxID=3075613 RepID=UPI002A80B666|nr:DUF4097 family beta strand repeat-containing protein [Streptomyces sp. CRN 30]
MVRTRRVRAGAVTGVVAVLVGALAACGAEAGEDSDPEQRSFALQGRALTIDSDDSALELVPADVGEVRVTRWFAGRAVVGSAGVSWGMEDDRLELRTKCRGFITSCSARHRVEVPRGVAVTVKSTDGSVTAKGFEEALRISTADGSVRVSDSSGPLEVDSEDGAVRAEGIEAPSVKARTEDGSVRLELRAVPDLLEARSADGSVDIALPQETYRVTAESSDGSVDVSVPRDESSDHVVTARTNDGSIKVRTAN